MTKQVDSGLELRSPSAAASVIPDSVFALLKYLTEKCEEISQLQATLRSQIDSQAVLIEKQAEDIETLERRLDRKPRS